MLHNAMGWPAYWTLVAWMCLWSPPLGIQASRESSQGTLAGDVQNWAMLIQNYILQLASEGIKRQYTQSLFDTANYTFEEKRGDVLVRQVQEDLKKYFSAKRQAAMRIVEETVAAYNDMLRAANRSVYPTTLTQIDSERYRDTDIPSRLPYDLGFSPYFKQPVSMTSSAVKISDEVPRDDVNTIKTVSWTSKLDKTFKYNSVEDTLIRWQYFGSNAGLTRMYPGREWKTNFAGFYNDYDPRTRPWYIAATGGPKDIVIILDCSLSMKGEKFTIAQAVAKTIINTLTKQDYVNVICARASHWDEVGKWNYFSTKVLSCQQNRLVAASIAHRKDLIEKTYQLKPGGTSELEDALDKAFTLLGGGGETSKTGCQSIVVFVTDGKDTDGEQVRCGPGYYTRSGYVPGPICKYNWTKAWDKAAQKNQNLFPQARFFSYLTIDDGEEFPGKLSCDHGGFMKKLSSGENLISEMSDYFEFLSGNVANSEGLWTSPYLDEWGLGLMVTYVVPAISQLDGRTIGVVGIDATLEEIENFLSHHQWGTVYSFLIDTQGETIFHPRLKPSTKLVDDPIFIPIEQLELKNGKPAEFFQVMKDMMARKSGHLRIEKGRKGLKKDEYIPATYYYASIDNSEYSFAFSFSDTDKVFRRAQVPLDLTGYDKSYFNLLIEYNSTLARGKHKGTFQYLQVKSKEKKYPNLRVSYLHSSIFLAPKCHCDPNAYFYDDDLAQKTVDAHDYINGLSEDIGCEKKGKYQKGIRADVLITQAVEKLWKERDFEGVDDVKWTYVGMRSGLFRTYPAHRSTRTYDPSKRSWYKRASSNPSKTTISTAYMDAAGVGKIITVSQPLFEGMMSRLAKECLTISKTGPWPGGCMCNEDSDCIIGHCYVSKAPGHNHEYPRCATERVEAVTSLDILYSRFHEITTAQMQASDLRHSCGQNYLCPNGQMGCQTRCYLFDDSAKLITDPDFLTADSLDESKYKSLSVGQKEGEVMKDLIYKHKFFGRTEAIDFQGVCHISPYAPKVTLEGIPGTPEALDNYYKNKGPIPKFNNDFGCITDVVGYRANASALGHSRMITGNVSGPCMSGFYYVTELPRTNLFLMVIENRQSYRPFFNFNCRIAQSLVNSGAYRIINGTCAHTAAGGKTLRAEGKCPRLRDITIACAYQAAQRMAGVGGVAWVAAVVAILTGRLSAPVGR